MIQLSSAEFVHIVVKVKMVIEKLNDTKGLQVNPLFWC